MEKTIKLTTFNAHHGFTTYVTLAYHNPRLALIPYL